MKSSETREIPEPARKDSSSTGIQAVEKGLGLLRILVRSPGGMPLTTLAAAAGMPPAMSHKYLASFIRAGLVTQSGSGGLYDLGPFALELGFAAMRRMDVIEIGRGVLEDLRDQVGSTAAMAVWGNQGPTIVRAAEPMGSFATHIRIGTVLPLLTSSFGRCFAAFLDRRFTKELMQQELSDPEGPAARAGLRTLEQVEAMLAEIRSQRMSRATTLVHSGRMALSAPVFDRDRHMIAAISVIGFTESMDFSPEGQPAQVLEKAARGLSRMLNAPL
jgi:DNA-binding IclR family transcriptional regulator